MGGVINPRFIVILIIFMKQIHCVATSLAGHGAGPTMLRYSIVSVELEQMLITEGCNLAEEEDGVVDWPWSSPSPHPLASHLGSGSGGWAHHVFLNAAEELFPSCRPELSFRSQRSNNFEIVFL